MLAVDNLSNSFCSVKVIVPWDAISCIFCFVESNSEFTDSNSDLSSDKAVFVSSNACWAFSWVSTIAFWASLFDLLMYAITPTATALTAVKIAPIGWAVITAHNFATAPVKILVIPILAVSAAFNPSIVAIWADSADVKVPFATACSNIAIVTWCLTATCPSSAAVIPILPNKASASALATPVFVANSTISAWVNAEVALVSPAFANTASTSAASDCFVIKICRICSSVAPLLANANTACSVLKPLIADLNASKFPVFIPTVARFIPSNAFKAIPSLFNSDIIVGNCLNIMLYIFATCLKHCFYKKNLL